MNIKLIFLITLRLFLRTYIKCEESVENGNGVVQLTTENFDSFISENELVMTNFYAPWCRFSVMLETPFRNAGKRATGINDKIKFAGVNCVEQKDLCNKININKYPTVNVYLYGIKLPIEYNGGRDENSLYQFAIERIKIIKSMDHSEESIKELNHRDSYVFGLFKKDSKEYIDLFEKSNTIRRSEPVHIKLISDDESIEETIQFLKHGTVTHSIKLPDADLTLSKLNDLIDIYSENFVKKLTLENVQSLTEKGKYFVILLHNYNDKSEYFINDYVELIEKEMGDYSKNYMFLQAHVDMFSHPLIHLGKSKEDVPLIILDSFKHLYLFPNKPSRVLKHPDELKKFLDDNESGKLHRDFHDPTIKSNEIIDDEDDDENVATKEPQKNEDVTIQVEEKENKESEHGDVTYAQSSFKLLTPSPYYYSFKEEL